MQLEDQLICWPTQAERTDITTATFHELPYCLGYLDGTDIPLVEAPALDHTSYFSRKQRYAIKAQVVCDYNLKIRHLVVGYPGSVHDARIFANSNLNKDPNKYFSDSQCLAADSAYRLTQYVITPFRRNSSFATSRERQKFNKYFSGFRVRVENCFGILKQKFSCLKELRIRIKDFKGHRHVCDWVTVCCILHNVILPYLDPEDLTFTADNDTDSNQGEHGIGRDDENGEHKRQALFALIMEQNN